MTRGTLRRSSRIDPLLPSQGQQVDKVGRDSTWVFSSYFVVLTLRSNWLELPAPVLVPFLSTPSTHKSDFPRLFPDTLERLPEFK